MAYDTPTVTILLLGDPEVGKSTFLSRLTLGAHVSRTPLVGNDDLPPYALPTLRDLDQPFLFNIKMYNRPYQFEFYDTASPVNYTLLRPDFVIVCFDISRRNTLASLTGKWREVIATHYSDENMPVMVLGLKRDLRKEWTAAEKEFADKASKDREGRIGGAGGGFGSWGDAGDTRSIMPQEGLRVAQELRCDRYAECSALTGELCREVLEDIARTAAKSTTDKGAKGDGGCAIM